MAEILGIPRAISSDTKVERASSEAKAPIYYSATLLEQAYSLYQVAVNTDQDQRYDEAYRLYLVVAQRLESALECKSHSDDMEAAWRRKCVEDRERIGVRAQQIRVWLDQTRR